MPFLRPTDNPPFEVVEEVLDFVDQILEVRSGQDQVVSSLTHCQGLVFMHSHGVAHRLAFTLLCDYILMLLLLHRDCSLKNILVDATHMYPLGFHPVHDLFLDDLTSPAPMIARLEVGVRYYFVDYGISSYFPAGSQRELVLGVAGRDQDVPELSNDAAYDPFKVDIFTVGNVLRGEIQAVCFTPPPRTDIIVSLLCRITPT
jgi:serine/threonine protein kinase